MTTLLELAEKLLANARAAERRVKELGKFVDSRDDQVARAEEIVKTAAEQRESPLGRQMARRELGRRNG